MMYALRFPRFSKKMILIWMFPKIVVPPNHPILIGFCIINHPFWGTPILGNTHIPFGYHVKAQKWWCLASDRGRGSWTTSLKAQLDQAAQAGEPSTWEQSIFHEPGELIPHMCWNGRNMCFFHALYKYINRLDEVSFYGFKSLKTTEFSCDNQCPPES